MQSLSLAQLRPELHSWQRRIYMDFPWRKNPSSIQFCLLSFCSLCASEAAEPAQERETFQQFIHIPSPSFNFAQLDVAEKMFTLQPHLHQWYTLTTYSFRAGAIHLTGGVLMPTKELLPGARGPVHWKFSHSKALCNKCPLGVLPLADNST